MIDWDFTFRTAHERSWPTAGLCIQNVNPSPGQGSRNIYREDEVKILAAARKYGYGILPGPQRIVSFVKGLK